MVRGNAPPEALAQRGTRAGSSAIVGSRMKRLRPVLTTLVTSMLLLLLLVPAALADAPHGGTGTYGEANDKVVTNAGFIVIAFFPTLILVLSLLQWRLDKRRDARRAARKRRQASADWSGGW
jgi:hypothetical protein